MDKAPHYIIERVWTAELPKELSNSYLESRDQHLPRVIYPDIRVLTANKGTQNDTFYPEESLRGDPDRGTGLISFNRPYAIPILRDHLDSPSSDGRYASEVYGRIYHPAQIHSDSGDKYLRCMATITHPEAVEAILTGRWLTVSLGSKTDSVRCSICKGELTEGLCDHQKGKMYETDDKEGGSPAKCRWVIGPIRAREVSFVVSPSDDQAAILNPNLKESVSQISHVIPRLLVGDDRGVFDLATGQQVSENDLFSRPRWLPRPSKTFGGLTLLGSAAVLNESRSETSGRRDQPEEPLSESEATQWMKEDFIGPGKYLLSGWDHDHTVVLDQRGDGTSSPGQMPPTQFQSPGYMYPTNSAEALGGTGPSKGRGMGDGDNTRPDPAPVQSGDTEDHTHEVLGGRVMKAGYPTHSHDLEPAHAALETHMPDKKEIEAAASETVNDETPLTLGVLYNLPEEDEEYNTPDCAEESIKEAKLSSAARDALDSSAFCGPDRSFPAHDKAHVTAGLRLLNRSKYSSEQKARIHGCLSGRAKKYGISAGGQEAFAAKLIDTNHHIEFGLYPLPSNNQETVNLLEQMKAMAHTPSEKEQILSRISAHCKDILPMSVWQQHFGELTSCESGEPVVITVNAENYGLLYTLSTAAVMLTDPEASAGNGAEIKTEGSPDAGSDSEKTPVEAAPVAKEIETESGIPIVALPKQTEAVTDSIVSDDPSSDIVRETMKSLQTRVKEADQRARYALAHSAAIYMKALRKPFTRGKSNEELIEALSKRSPDSLQDTLNDLLQELETGGLTAPQPLPKLEDPTQSVTEVTPPVKAAAATETAHESTNTTESVPSQSARKTMLHEMQATELPDEEEETFTVLGHLFDLKVLPKK